MIHVGRNLVSEESAAVVIGHQPEVVLGIIDVARDLGSYVPLKVKITLIVVPQKKLSGLGDD